MNQPSNRIREYRRARAMSLQELAERVGTSKSQIDKLERGQRRLTSEWMVRLAGPLECDPRALIDLSELDLHGLGPEAATFAYGTGPMLPVRGLARRDDDSEKLYFTSDPIDHVARPPVLMHTRDAYALYVVDTSMMPMYRPRQVLFVNPHKPAAAECGVVMTLRDNSVLIRQLVKQKKNDITVRAYGQRSGDTEIPLAQIASCHLIVGSIEPQ